MNPMPFNLGFVVDRVVLGSLYSGYFGFSASVSLPTRVPYSFINL